VAGFARESGIALFGEFDYLAPFAGGQGGQHGIGTIGEETHRLVRKQKVCPARMQAPEVKDIGLGIDGAALKMVWTGRTEPDEETAYIQFPRSQDTVGRAGAELADTGISNGIGLRR
jgi:hypothetical protein